MSDHPGKQYFDEAKVLADAERVQVHDASAARVARKQDEPADSETAGLVKGLLQPERLKGKGGRRKGSKTRRPALIAAERILRVINRLGEKWMQRLAEKQPYLFVQLAKRVIPGAPPMEGGEAGELGERPTCCIRVVMDDPPPPSPEPPSKAEAAPVPVHTAASPQEDIVDRVMSDWPLLKDILQRLSAADLLKAASSGRTDELRRVIHEAAEEHAERVKRHKQQHEEQRALRRRDRMLRDPSAWSGGHRMMPFFGRDEELD